MDSLQMASDNPNAAIPETLPLSRQGYRIAVAGTVKLNYMVLAIEPDLLKQIGQDWVNPDRIELVPRFMSNFDRLIHSFFSMLKAEVETGGMGGHLLVDSLTIALVIHLLRHYCSTQPKPIKDITVPMYLFFGEADPFIPGDCIHQIESRFQELGKEFWLKVYPDADHGFFCHERSSYHPSAAADAWRELTQFFHHQLQTVL